MKRNFLTILIAAVLLSACGARSLNASEPDILPAMGGGSPVYVEESYMEAAPAPMAMPTQMAYSPDSKSGGGNEPASIERMVIRNADLAIVVEDPEAAMIAISKLAEDLGGFVVSSNLYEAYTSMGLPVPEANVVIRVPAEKLNETLEKIKADVVEVQSESVSGQDVTSTYVDLESQLKNLEAAEAQLMKIMENATETEDVLNVFNQLTSIRGQIESIKGQMKYYEESAALSAVSVRLIAEETVQPLEVGGWQIKGWARDAVQSLLIFLQDFTRFLINLVISFLPKLLVVALIFGLPIWLIVRAVRKASRKRKAQAAPQEEK